MKTVYLAGPIMGCTKGEANDWRHYACARLAGAGITGISPLRCEPLIGERYGATYNDPRFGVARAIAAKNIYDVQSCDMALFYFPPEEVAGFDTRDEVDVFKWPSVGTLLELGAVRALDKPSIVVCENTLLFKHPVFDAFSSWLLTDLDEGIDVAVGVLQDYSQGNQYQRDMKGTY